VAIRFLQGLEQCGGGSADFLVFQGSGIERQGTAQHLVRKGALLFHGEMFEGVQQCFGISAHEHIIPVHRRSKKKSFTQERKGFYERGCQVKTLLLLEEGFVLLGIQPPAD
jgi:hypothetical protein